MNDYNQEFSQAWNRTLRLGLALLPIRLQVRKDCIDLPKALPVIVDCFNQHPSDKLRGRTAAIHNMLQPRLSEALGGLPLYLTDDRLDRARRDAPGPTWRGADQDVPHREVGGVAARGGAVPSVADLTRA